MEAQYHETIYKMTIVDGLTGVNNKRFFLDAMDREIPRARRHQRLFEAGLRTHPRPRVRPCAFISS